MPGAPQSYDRDSLVKLWGFLELSKGIYVHEDPMFTCDHCRTTDQRCLLRPKKIISRDGALKTERCLSDGCRKCSLGGRKLYTLVDGNPVLSEAPQRGGSQLPETSDQAASTSNVQLSTHDSQTDLPIDPRLTEPEAVWPPPNHDPLDEPVIVNQEASSSTSNQPTDDSTKSRTPPPAAQKSAIPPVTGLTKNPWSNHDRGTKRVRHASEEITPSAKRTNDVFSKGSGSSLVQQAITLLETADERYGNDLAAKDARIQSLSQEVETLRKQLEAKNAAYDLLQTSTTEQARRLTTEAKAAKTMLKRAEIERDAIKMEAEQLRELANTEQEEHA